MKLERYFSPPAVLAWTRLMRVYNAVAKKAAEEVSRDNLSLPRFDVVAQLGAMGTCATQDALGRRLMVTKGNVSILIQKMAEDGLVSRAENPSNRRRNTLCLTKKGAALRRKVLPKHEKWISGVFACLSRREQAALTRLLDKILSRLDAGPESGKTSYSRRHKS